MWINAEPVNGALVSLAIGLIIASGVAATHFSRANPAESD